jgi:hypothetical protein
VPEVDTGIAPEHRWLFRGRSDHQPLTTRQFSRLFKEAAKSRGAAQDGLSAFRFVTALRPTCSSFLVDVGHRPQ